MTNYKNRITGHGVEPLDGILFNPMNWRIHPGAQQQALEGVLDTVGWVQDVIVNQHTGHLVDGHLRCQVAARNGDKTIPVVYVDLSEEEEALVLSTIDPIAAMAATDRSKLDDLLQSVQSDDERVQALIEGIADREGIQFGEPPEDVDPQIDKAEELRVKWGVETGQLWQLGEHRIICGDCTDKSVVDRVMGGEKANLCFTSPPYWVGKNYETQDSVEAIDGFILSAAKQINNAVSVDYSRVVINTSTGFTTSFDKRQKRQTLLLIDKWTNAFYSMRWNLRHIRHWLKQGQLASISAKADMIDQHCEWLCTYEHDDGAQMQFEDKLNENEVEALLTFYNVSGRGRGRGRGRGQEHLGNYHNAKEWALKSYWDDIHGNANTNNHCAAFPLELVERHLVIYTKDGEVVFEPFSGSGTTIISCERLHRKCRAIEISPGYVAVAIQRWVDVTGGTPVLLENTGNG